MKILIIILITSLFLISCNNDADAIEGGMETGSDSGDSLTEKLINDLSGAAASINPEGSFKYGKIKWKEWRAMATWSGILSDGYEYNEKAIDKIKENYSKDIHQIFVFGGMWCPDSELSLPIIYEIIRKAGINDDDEVELFSLDEDKSEPTHTSVQMNVKKVPTVIVVENDIELGRIVEFPKVSWEEDLADILNNN